MSPDCVSESLISAIYEAALFEGQWREALDRFRQSLNSAEAALTIFESFPCVATQYSSGRMFTPEQRNRYSRSYAHLDPKLPIVSRRPVGFLFNDISCFDERFVAHDPFYQEFTIPMGLRHTLLTIIRKEDTREYFLAANRTSRSGPYDAQAESTFRRIGRHFQRAMALRNAIDSSQLVAAAARATLDTMRFGVVVLGGSGRVVMANRAAQQATAAGEPLQLREGRFSARSAQTTAQIEAVIAKALPPQGIAGALRIPRANEVPWNIWIAPLPAHTPLSPEQEPGVLVLIGPADTRGGLRAEELMAFYALTRAEAELALALVAGASLVEAAAARNVKVSTARSQLLAILQKTGTRRQSDLVRLLSMLPGAMVSGRCV